MGGGLFEDNRPPGHLLGSNAPVTQSINWIRLRGSQKYFQRMFQKFIFSKKNENVFHCHYEIGIVPKFGGPLINLVALRGQNPPYKRGLKMNEYFRFQLPLLL